MTTRSALITRKQLNPYEEARAVKAMIDRGLTENGAAQALGWHKARVSARLKLLELPERGQQLIGTGVIPLGAVDQLRVIGTVAPALLDAVIAFIDDGNDWAAERLTREPGWVIDAALQRTAAAARCSPPTSTAPAPHEIAELRLGKKAEPSLSRDRACTADRPLRLRPPTIRFSDDDVDQARAAGVLIEFDHARPIIVDRPNTANSSRRRSSAPSTSSRTKPPRGRAQAADQARRPGRPRPAHDRKAARTPTARARRPGARRQPRPRHQPDHRPSTVNPADMDVARFFVFALLGTDLDRSPYTQAGERVARSRSAASGW